MMHNIIRAIVSYYQKGTFKPFKKGLKKIYQFYKEYYQSKIIVAKVDGILYELDPNEYIDSRILYEGCFEPYTCDAINRLCRKGMTVFDIGANIGCHTLRFAKLAGPEGRVIAFEPMSWAFTKLQRNIDINRFTNIILEKIAFSNMDACNQEVAFACRWPLSGFEKTKLHPVHKGYAMHDTVDFLRLDTYMEQKSIGRIDIIKIDVDGYEHKIIEGAVKTLQVHKPLLIMELCDYSLRETGGSAEGLISALSTLGYRFFSEQLVLLQNEDELLEMIPPNASINVILSYGGLSI